MSSIIYYENDGFHNYAKPGKFLDIDDGEVEIHSKNIHKNVVIHDNKDKGQGSGDSGFNGYCKIAKGLNVGYWKSNVFDSNFMSVSRTDDTADKNKNLLILKESGLA